MKNKVAIVLIIAVVFTLIQSTLTYADTLSSTPGQIYVTEKRSYAMNLEVPKTIYIRRIVNNAVYQGSIRLTTYKYNASTDRHDATYGGYIPRVSITPWVVID